MYSPIFPEPAIEYLEKIASEKIAARRRGEPGRDTPVSIPQIAAAAAYGEAHADAWISYLRRPDTAAPGEIPEIGRSDDLALLFTIPKPGWRRGGRIDVIDTDFPRTFRWVCRRIALESRGTSVT